MRCDDYNEPLICFIDYYFLPTFDALLTFVVFISGEQSVVIRLP